MLSPQIAFDDLPGTIRAAWHAATDARDPFGDGTATGYAAPTRTMVLEAALGFFHWLARAHGLTDGPSPGALVTRARVAAWLAGRPDLAPASAYTHANALKLFVQASDPRADTRPLQLLANAYRRGIPRSDAWKLGLPDRDQVIDHGLAMVAAGTAEPAPPVDDARRARDGLVIALMGWTPKRTADVGRLTLGDHLRTFGGEARVVVQPQKTAPHAGARAVPLPPEIQAALTAYLAHAWPVLTGQPPPPCPPTKTSNTATPPPRRAPGARRSGRPAPSSGTPRARG